MIKKITLTKTFYTEPIDKIECRDKRRYKASKELNEYEERFREKAAYLIGSTYKNGDLTFDRMKEIFDIIIKDNKAVSDNDIIRAWKKIWRGENINE